MARFRRWLVQGLAVFSTGLAGWFTTGIVAVWGASYLVQCYLTLESPGVPIVLPYDSVGGKQTLAAKSFHFDLAQRQVEFVSPRIDANDGTVPVKADFVTVSLVSNRIKANARGLVVDVVRDRSGEFNVSSLLPKPVEGVEAPTFEFDAKKARVRYSDTDGGRISKWFDATDVRFKQGPNDSLGSATVSTEGLHGVRSRVQLGPSGSYWLKFERIDGDVSDLLPFAMRLWGTGSSPLSAIEATGLVVQGAVEVASAGKGPVDVRGALKVEGERVVWDKGQVAGRLSASLEGSLERAWVTARLVDGDRVATYEGQASMGQDIRLVGRTTLHSGHRPWGALTASLPKGMSVGSGDLQGYLTLEGTTFGLQGRGTLSSFALQGERLDAVTGSYAFDGRKFAVSVNDSKWRGSKVAGALAIDSRDGSLLAAAQLPDRSLAALGKEMGVDWIGGTGRAQLVVSGTTRKPQVELFAEGNAIVRVPDHDEVTAGPFEARIGMDGSLATIKRLTVSGANGLLLLTGNADLNSKNLDLNFVLGAVPASLFNAETEGTLFAKGEVRGTFAQPLYDARVEGYGLEYRGRGAAQVVAEIQGDRDQADVTSLRALSGTGTATAAGRVEFKSKAIEGTFAASNLYLSELLGDSFLGTVTVQEGRVAGTYDDPKYSARIAGENLTAYGTAVDALDLVFSGTSREVLVDQGTVSLGEGRVNGHGSYSFADGTATVSASAKDVPVARLLRPGPELAFEGKAGGQFDGKLDAKGWNGQGSFSLAAIALNGTPIGAGQLECRVEDSKVSVTGDIGSVDRYLSLDRLNIDPDRGGFDAQIAAYNIRVRDVIAATKPVWDNKVSAPPEWFETADGAFSGTASITADEQAWTLTESNVTLDHLTIVGRNAGTIVATVSKVGPMWKVPKVEWKEGATTLSANGSYSENGQIDVQATLNEFDLSWIKALEPDTPLVTGHASVTIVASGDKSDPTGRASLLVDDARFTFAEGQSASDPVFLLLDNVTFGSKHASIAGHASFLGFTGAVSAALPYDALKSDSGRGGAEPLSARIQFDDRPLKDFEANLPNVDMSKSDGTLALSANVTGTIDELKVAADARFQSSRLALKNADSELHNVLVGYHQADRRATLTASADSGRGGRFALDLAGNLAHVFSADFNVDELLDDSTVEGTVRFDQFLWSEKLPGAAFPTTAKSDGLLKISGPLRTPLVAGSLGLDQVVVNLPNEFVAGTAGVLPIDPRFDNVLVTANKGSRIETGLGALNVSGSGRVGGSLSEPDVAVPLTLDSGNFRLPSGRIALEPGGRILVTYASIGGGEPVARADLDLEGHTTVVTRTVNGQYEPFRVTLNIRGNAMDENNVHLTATSDPPDLSQDEILALIGQRDLIQGLAQGVLGGQGDSGQLRQAFYSYAIPSFAGGLTQGLATGLNLDYLSLDYNPFDQLILSAGKTIAKDLVLHITRQVQGTEFGPLRYEVKLEYRLPVADRFFSRVRLGFGFDQSVPWKLTLNWSKRF